MSGPHQGQPIRSAGAPLEEARAVMIMVHGRGGQADDILALVPILNRTDFAYLAPQAANNTWYPYSFMAPIERNEPGITSGMQAIRDVLSVTEAAGVPAERTVLLGFSQGACLSLEFSARNATRYGGVVCLSGGLIGPDGTPRNYTGSLAGTPVFLGCSDVDPHIPRERVEHSADVMRSLEADVTIRIYPGLGHVINEDEFEHARGMMDAVE
jgi:phospholipase/carboxylesterase